MSPRDNAAVTVRPGAIDDLPRLTDIYNHYVVETPATFDVDPFTVDARREWFDRYAPTGRHRLLVAEEHVDGRGDVLGFVTTSRFHPRAAYDTTVEMTVVCAPEAVGRRVGELMYTHLFEAIAGEDIRLAIAAITMPNDASVALHERFGFSRNALLPDAGRKFGRYWDVAWMTRRMEGARIAGDPLVSMH